MAFRSISPNINVNTQSGPLRTELQNTFTRLDGQLSLAPYRLDYDVGPVSNSGGTGVILSSATLEYNTLNTNGQSIRISAAGTTAANANNKNILIYLGTTLLFETGDQPINDGEWVLEAEIIRTSGISQYVWVKWFCTDTLTEKVTVTSSGVDLSSNQDLTIRGLANNNEIVLYYAKYVFLP